MGALADKLATLDRAAEVAGERWREAQGVADRERETTSAVLAEVVQYDRDVFYRRGEADPAEALRVTREACERIIRDGLVLIPLGEVPTAGVVAFDPSAASDLEDATRTLNAARSERDAFVRDFSGDLAAERNAEAMQRVRDALGGNDPAELAAALA